MRKIIFLLFSVISCHVFSQAHVTLTSSNSFVSARAGVHYVMSSPKPENYISAGSSYLHKVSSKVVVGANIDFYLSGTKPNLFNLEPRVDYYFKEAFKGLHIGSNLGLNLQIYSGELYQGFNLGVSKGCTFFLNKDKSLFFDATLSSGITKLIENGGSFQLSARPVLSMGFRML